MARSPLLVKIRALHRDARRTLSTPTRRASHFFPYARLSQLFNIANHLYPATWPLVPLYPHIAEQVKRAYKSKRRDAHRNRGGSCWTATWFTRAAVECALCDLPNIEIMERTGGPGKMRRPQGSTRFSSSRWRIWPHDIHQEGR